jgi:predicted phosphodiesterase
MRTIIFSDLHGSMGGLQTVLRDAERAQADRLIYLGDVGNDATILAALQSREIACVFGNWEVSGLQRLPASWAAWVGAWPAKIVHDNIGYTHATPDVPPAVTTTTAAVHHMQQGMAQGLGWGDLFPRLHNNESARWAALAALEAENLRAAFHGHTHIQQVWTYRKQRWHEKNGPVEFSLDPGTDEQPTRYLIGVGSAGAPQDGPLLRFARYDDRTHTVQLVAVKEGS